MRYASRYTLRLCRSTRTRNASRSPASVRWTAMASLSTVVSTLSLIRFIRQDFRVAVRSVLGAIASKGGLPTLGRALNGNTVSLQRFCGLAALTIGCSQRGADLIARYTRDEMRRVWGHASRC